MSFGLVFIACELCERVSDAFEQISDVIAEKLAWYKYPSEIKRILPMIIVNAQEPIAIECFGSISCSRMVFQKVSHSSLTNCNRTQWPNADKLYKLFEIVSGNQQWIFILYGTSSILQVRVVFSTSVECFPSSIKNMNFWINSFKFILNCVIWAPHTTL